VDVELANKNSRHRKSMFYKVEDIPQAIAAAANAEDKKYNKKEGAKKAQPEKNRNKS
jgi:hypothetical protein